MSRWILLVLWNALRPAGLVGLIGAFFTGHLGWVLAGLIVIIAVNFVAGCGWTASDKQSHRPDSV